MSNLIQKAKNCLERAKSLEQLKDFIKYLHKQGYRRPITFKGATETDLRSYIEEFIRNFRSLFEEFETDLTQEFQQAVAAKGIPYQNAEGHWVLDVDALSPAKRASLVSIINCYIFQAYKDDWYDLDYVALELNLVGDEEHQLPESLVACLSNGDANELAMLALMLTESLYFKP